jgi:2-keto-4-pentenoate hydratase
MTGAREETLTMTANTLMDARREARPILSIPPELVPANLDEVYVVQDQMVAAVGEIGGWKIGAPNPDATPMFAPMPAEWMAPSGSTLSGSRWRYRGLEAEIAFLVGEDLPPPPPGQPYTREQVLSAMASCHPAIEVLESAFVDPAQVPREAMLADLQMHGGFVFGPAYPTWRFVDFSQEKVTLIVDSVVRVERVGSNTSGDLLKLLPWLANEGAARTGGLRKGQWVTTGSWTGNTLADARSDVEAGFSTVGAANLRFTVE